MQQSPLWVVPLRGGGTKDNAAITPHPATQSMAGKTLRRKSKHAVQEVALKEKERVLKQLACIA